MAKSSAERWTTRLGRSPAAVTMRGVGVCARVTARSCGEQAVRELTGSRDVA